MLGSLHDAEDVVGGSLVRAGEKRASLTSPQAYRAWLYRIATNLCLTSSPGFRDALYQQISIQRVPLTAPYHPLGRSRFG